MTSKQFVAALLKIGANQSSFARALGITNRNVRRWASGETKVPSVTSALLKLAIKHGDKLEDLEI